MHPFSRLVTVVVVVVGAYAAAAAEGDSPLDRARELTRAHRYPQAIKILEPYVGTADLDPAERFAAHAELGRSYFHLGRYDRAYDAFRVAAELQPTSVEVALYVEACSWLTGRTEQALRLFEQIVATGARNLHRAVTLPGERQFLADPRVWEILQRHAQSMVVGLRRGSLFSVSIGMPREAVLELLPETGHQTGTVLAARAGRFPLWALEFDDDDRVSEIVVEAENVLRYTPFRITCPCGLDWRMTPRVARAMLGEPAVEENRPDGTALLHWRFEGIEAVLLFGPPRPPRPPSMAEDTPVLKIIRLLGITAGPPASG